MRPSEAVGSGRGSSLTDGRAKVGLVQDLQLQASLGALAAHCDRRLGLADREWQARQPRPGCADPQDRVRRHRRQLRQIPQAQVFPEITYGPDKRRSVDWIVVLEDVVLLVEVKSTRPSPLLLLGTFERKQEMQKSLRRAFEQIDHSATLIRTRAGEFADVPADRPFHGLVVTMEPFHTVNGSRVRRILPTTDPFVTVISVEELEHLVVVTDTGVGQLLLKRAADSEKSTSALHESLVGHQGTRNAVLDQAWSTYPWKRGTPAAAAQDHLGPADPPGRSTTT